MLFFSDLGLFYRSRAAVEDDDLGLGVVGAYRNSESERCSVGHTTVQGFIRQKMIFFMKPKAVERERVLDNGK